jgi:hypothetical protein
VDIEVVQTLNGWPAQRREFASEDTLCGAGEDLGEDRTDRRASLISDNDAVMAHRPARTWGWARLGAELGRPWRKWSMMIFPI